MIALIWQIFRSPLGSFLILFFKFLRERRADDPRLLSFVLEKMKELEGTDLSGSKKAQSWPSSLLIMPDGSA